MKAREKERERKRDGENESRLRHRCRRYILQEDLVISKLVIRLFDKTIFFTYERAFRWAVADFSDTDVSH